MKKIKEKNKEITISKVEFIKSCSDQEAQDRLDKIFDMLLDDKDTDNSSTK